MKADITDLLLGSAIAAQVQEMVPPSLCITPDTIGASELCQMQAKYAAKFFVENPECRLIVCSEKPPGAWNLERRTGLIFVRYRRRMETHDGVYWISHNVAPKAGIHSIGQEQLFSDKEGGE